MDEASPKRNLNRTWIAILLIGGSAAITLALIILSDDRIRFDSKKWQETSSFNGVNLRQRMADDLQRNVLIYGMTRLEIDLLLGKDDGMFISDEYDFVYRLGSEPSTGTVTRYGQSIQVNGREQWLTLTLDGNERLVDWRVVKH